MEITYEFLQNAVWVRVFYTNPAVGIIKRAVC